MKCEDAIKSTENAQRFSQQHCMSTTFQNIVWCCLYANDNSFQNFNHHKSEHGMAVFRSQHLAIALPIDHYSHETAALIMLLQGLSMMPVQLGI